MKGKFHDDLEESHPYPYPILTSEYEKEFCSKMVNVKQYYWTKLANRLIESHVVNKLGVDPAVLLPDDILTHTKKYEFQQIIYNQCRYTPCQCQFNAVWIMVNFIKVSKNTIIPYITTSKIPISNHIKELIDKEMIYVCFLFCFVCVFNLNF